MMGFTEEELKKLMREQNISEEKQKEGFNNEIFQKK